jgi:TIR domain/Protein of unknown function (DUF3298)
VDQANLVFLSYASNDRDRVEICYNYLKERNISVWMDVKCLKAGQNWDFEIKRALQQASIVVVFLSLNSINKRGYIQREIKIALDKAQEKLIDDIYIIPVLLDKEAPIPPQLAGIQCVLPEKPDWLDVIYDSIFTQISKVNINIEKVQGASKLNWSLQKYEESWEGLPGYEVSFQYHKFTSSDYRYCEQIGNVISGWLFAQLMEQRKVKIEQSPEFINFAQDKFQRQNTWDASCEEPVITDKMISIVYSVFWYGAGAAHPNSFSRTFNFMIEPLLYISRLRDLFENQEDAFVRVQTFVRQQLKGKRISEEETEAEPYQLDEDWVDNGTESWDDLQAFFFRESSIEIIFDPYSVAAYAFGRHVVNVPYAVIIDLIKNCYKYALGIQYLEYRMEEERRQKINSESANPS